MNKFLKGVCAGSAVVLTSVLAITAIRFFRERDRKLFEAMEQE